jgi:hypothetical protein
MAVFNEIYTSPFITDGMFIYAQSDYNIPALDTEDWDDNSEILTELCDLLNGKRNKVSFRAVSITNDIIGIVTSTKSLKLRVRGYGYLMKARKLTSDEAEEIQDEFAKWVVAKINTK